MTAKEPLMFNTSISTSHAKASFAHLVRQAEAGQTLHITRRGKPVAVLLSSAEFDKLRAPRGNWVAFSQAWR